MLWGNALSGSLPTELGFLADLGKLSPGKPLYVGLHLFSKVRLCRFDLHDSRLIFLFTELLSMSSNKLTGSIPSQLALMTSLSEFWCGSSI